MSEPFKLKYLFLAEFTDGSTLRQTPDDKSSIDPEKRSQFYDVLHSNKTIRRFSLVGYGQIITVDLLTGFFEVNGVSLLLESEKLPTMPDRFELIFYRQHTHNLNTQYALNSGKVLKSDEAGHFCEYFIGWQCRISNKNYQVKMAIS